MKHDKYNVFALQYIATLQGVGSELTTSVVELAGTFGGIGIATSQEKGIAKAPTPPHN